MAAPWTVGSIVARLQLDTSAFSRGLTAALGTLKTFAHVALAPIKLISGMFGGIVKQVLSIKGLLVGFATFKLVNLAKEAEDVEGAFTNLQKSIGLTPENTLKALRKATKGTISDLDLMQSANNAVLLGVAKSTEEFMTLGDAARRLGKAMGQDAKEGLEDLMIALGRGSPKILDNLGIIVDVSQAYADYKRAMNLTRELTEGEQKIAFATKAFIEMRAKLKDLGADTLSFGDVFNAMKAQVANAAAVFAKSLIPTFAKVAILIGNVATKWSPVLKEFGQLINVVVDQAIIVLQKFWDRLRKGEVTIGDMLERVVDVLWRLIKGPLLKAVIAMAGLLGSAFWAAFGTSITDGVDYLKLRLTQALDDVISFIADRFGDIDFLFGGRVGFIHDARVALDELHRMLSIGTAAWETERKDPVAAQMAAQKKNIAVVEGAVLEFRDALKDLGKFAGEGGEELLKLGVGEEQAAETSKEFKGALDRVGAAMDKVGQAAANMSGDIDMEMGKARQTSEDLGEQWTTFLKRVQDVQTEVADFDLSDATKELKKFAREFAALPWTKMGPGSRVEANALFVQGYNALLQKQERWLSQQAKDVDKQVLRARWEQAMIGASEIERAVTDINLRFHEFVLDQKLSNAEAAKLAEKFEQLKTATAELVAARRAEEIRLKGAEIGREIEQIRWEKSALGANEMERAVHEVDEKFKALVADMRLTDEEAAALVPTFEKLKAATLDLKVATRAHELWSSFGSGLSGAIVTGITDGLARGEKWAKIWADVTANLFKESMTKAIQSIQKGIGDLMGKIASGLGLGAGWAGAAEGLIGFGTMILQNLRGKGTTTVEDFANQINSSEAVRGVVAGPTNVAISKVGDSLKTALRTTEALLDRIARAIEAGGGGGGGRGGAPRNAAYVLTPTTAS